MKHLLKAFSRKSGKRKYILLGLLGLEIAALPAAAQIVHRVAFEIKPAVTAVEIPTAEPGLSRYIVASNAGFTVDAVNVAGKVMVRVHKSGTISGEQRFGDAAQLPGAAMLCSEATGAPSLIYVAHQKTAAVKGTPPEQAVIFEFQYDIHAHPKFEFTAAEGIADVPMGCESGLT